MDSIRVVTKVDPWPWYKYVEVIKLLLKAISVLKILFY